MALRLPEIDNILKGAQTWVQQGNEKADSYFDSFVQRGQVSKNVPAPQASKPTARPIASVPAPQAPNEAPEQEQIDFEQRFPNREKWDVKHPLAPAKNLVQQVKEIPGGLEFLYNKLASGQVKVDEKIAGKVIGAVSKGTLMSYGQKEMLEEIQRQESDGKPNRINKDVVGKKYVEKYLPGAVPYINSTPRFKGKAALESFSANPLNLLDLLAVVSPFLKGTKATTVVGKADDIKLAGKADDIKLAGKIATQSAKKAGQPHTRGAWLDRLQDAFDTEYSRRVVDKVDDVKLAGKMAGKVDDIDDVKHVKYTKDIKGGNLVDDVPNRNVAMDGYVPANLDDYPYDTKLINNADETLGRRNLVAGEKLTPAQDASVRDQSWRHINSAAMRTVPDEVFKTYIGFDKADAVRIMEKYFWTGKSNPELIKLMKNTYDLNAIPTNTPKTIVPSSLIDDVKNATKAGKVTTKAAKGSKLTSADWGDILREQAKKQKGPMTSDELAQLDKYFEDNNIPHEPSTVNPKTVTYTKSGEKFSKFGKAGKAIDRFLGGQHDFPEYYANQSKFGQTVDKALPGGKLIDKSSQLAKSTYLTTLPWIMTNRIGNLMFKLMDENPIEFVRGYLDRLNPKMAKYIPDEVKQGFYGEGLTKAKDTGGLVNKIVDLNPAYKIEARLESVDRGSHYLTQLRRMAKETGLSLDDVSKTPALKREVLARTERTLGDYATPLFSRKLAGIDLFAKWQRAITKVTLNNMIEHPVKVAGLKGLGATGAKQADERNKALEARGYKVPEYLQYGTVIGKDAKGNPELYTRQREIPSSTLKDFAEAISNPLDPMQLSQFISNPLFQIPPRVLFSRTFYGGSASSPNVVTDNKGQKYYKDPKTGKVEWLGDSKLPLKEQAKHLASELFNNYGQALAPALRMYRQTKGQVPYDTEVWTIDKNKQRHVKDPIEALFGTGTYGSAYNNYPLSKKKEGKLEDLFTAQKDGTLKSEKKAQSNEEYNWKKYNNKPYYSNSDKPKYLEKEDSEAIVRKSDAKWRAGVEKRQEKWKEEHDYDSWSPEAKAKFEEKQKIWIKEQEHKYTQKMIARHLQWQKQTKAKNEAWKKENDYNSMTPEQRAKVDAKQAQYIQANEAKYKARLSARRKIEKELDQKYGPIKSNNSYKSESSYKSDNTAPKKKETSENDEQKHKEWLQKAVDRQERWKKENGYDNWSPGAKARFDAKQRQWILDHDPYLKDEDKKKLQESAPKTTPPLSMIGGPKYSRRSNNRAYSKPYTPYRRSYGGGSSYRGKSYSGGSKGRGGGGYDGDEPGGLLGILVKLLRTLFFGKKKKRYK